MPPWMQIIPDIIVYNAPRSSRCYVARKDEVDFLKAGGYRDVRAIGLPIIYTKPSGLQRTKNSLLVMPTHSSAFDVVVPSTEKYVREIASVQRRFSRVVACVAAPCMENGVLAKQFAQHGIPVLQGAGITDANSLKRMRALFESFEYVTTDNYGSHVFYALYFGAKVSIWGEPTPICRENLLKDGAWAPYPEAIDEFLSKENAEKAEVYLRPFRVEPWIGVTDVKSGEFMVGHHNKLSAEELRACFGWTPAKMVCGTVGETLRQSKVWRVGARVKRLLSTKGGAACF